MLRTENLVKEYGQTTAVNGLSINVSEGEFVSLLGPSGCGKTTTLHMIAGLTNPTEGKVFINDEDVTDKPPNERQLGVVFQSTALFPHMSVYENISYGLRMYGYDGDVDSRVDELLELIELPGHADKKPPELSGGQQQRVAIARALAYDPEILLLDEPLTGLDRVLRENMRKEIKRIQQEVGVTALYVTHDQEEALSMSDRIIVMNSGQKQQSATPKELYEKPANSFVANFVGKSTQFQGDITEAENGEKHVITKEGLEIMINKDIRNNGMNNGIVDLYVRPEDIHITNSRDNLDNVFTGNVNELVNLGSITEVTVEVSAETSLLAETTKFPNLKRGDEVQVGFNKSDVIVQ